ncbi:MAG: DNA polymerase III subunit gamma/tau [Zoogloeaceae bacterium]|jgi:DNA polymerase-3 subunit gamma/tau|nr:DNA polymerase III subunit gamma/tau [Zoogloeaceae bacterium]
MSYQVLARKWRPRNFSTLVGQEHVIRALTHALNEKRLHHAYLFTGTRGVGKTTIARILAKSLNCEAGVSSEPCGHCSACEEIDAGRFVDLLEVDAATNTKVDEMRQLLENAVYAPTKGRYKVYVIDEVHMLSNSAFNAMLKTLEEPPEHVKFILATTDPQKIPVTVLSRCLQFNLKQMPLSAIVEHLGRTLNAEGVPCEPDALTHIARAAAGSMRDALSLLDQAIAHGAGRVEAALVRDMLGTVDTSYLLDILAALMAADGAKMLQVAENMQTRSLSASTALQELAILLTHIQLLQLAPAAGDDWPERERLLALAREFTPEFVQLAYQIVTQGRAELPLAPDEYSGLAMTLLRLLAFSPTAAGATVAVRATPVAPAMMPAAPAQAITSPAHTISPPLPAAVPHPATRPAPPSAEAQPPLSPLPDANPDWHALTAQLNISGLARQLAQHCDLVSRDGENCVLQLASEHQQLLSKVTQGKLEQALAEHFGHAVKLSVDIGAVARATPAQLVSQQRQMRQKEAIAAIEGDAFVRDAIENLDAALDESSIKPTH